MQKKRVKYYIQNAKIHQVYIRDAKNAFLVVIPSKSVTSLPIVNYCHKKFHKHLQSFRSPRSASASIALTSVPVGEKGGEAIKIQTYANRGRESCYCKHSRKYLFSLVPSPKSTCYIN